MRSLRAGAVEARLAQIPRSARSLACARDFDLRLNLARDAKASQRQRGGMFSVALSVAEYPTPNIVNSTKLRMGHPLPDVIRHTALRSSDFPPRPFSRPCRFARKTPRSRLEKNQHDRQNGRGGRPVRLPTHSLYAIVLLHRGPQSREYCPKFTNHEGRQGTRRTQMLVFLRALCG